jgi:hypothetical protein
MTNKNLRNDFKIGDQVTWTSQAGGSNTTKVGKVVEVIRDTKSLWNARSKYADVGSHTFMFDGNVMMYPVVYFVEVKISKRVKPKLYMPRSNKLELVETK